MGISSPWQVEPLELACHGGIQHVGNAQARFRVDLHAPGVLEDRAHIGVLHVAIARQLNGESSPMSQEPCTLFWPRSGFTPTPSRPILPVKHGEVGDTAITGRGGGWWSPGNAPSRQARSRSAPFPPVAIEARCGAKLLRRNAGLHLRHLGGMAQVRDETRRYSSNSSQSQRSPDERLVIKLFRSRSSLASAVTEQPRSCRAEAAGDGRPPHAPISPGRSGAGRSTISFAPSRRRFLRPRGEDRVAVRGIRTDLQDLVGGHHAVGILRARGGCQRSGPARSPWA